MFSLRKLFPPKKQAQQVPVAPKTNTRNARSLFEKKPLSIDQLPGVPRRPITVSFASSPKPSADWSPSQGKKTA